MKSLTKANSRIISILWASLIFFLLVFAVKSIGDMDLRGGEQWKNYYSIYSSNPAPIESYLLDEGLPIISFNKSVLVYNDISDMKSVSLNSVSERFSAIDPRFDPYMKNVFQLFTASSKESDFSIIYIEKNSIALAFLYAKLFSAFRDSGIQWTISGFQPLNLVLLFLVFLFSFVGLIISSPFEKWKTVFAICGWIPFVLLYGIPALSLSVAMPFFIMKRKSILFPIVVMLLVLILMYYSSDLNLFMVLCLLLGVFSTIFPLFGGPYADKKSASPHRSRRWKEKRVIFKKPEHQLFSPVQIMTAPIKTTIVSEPRRNNLMPMAIFLMVLICGIAAVYAYPEVYTVPIAQEISSVPWTLENTEHTATKNSILSPADYITHIAFQEGFLYGTDWTYPQRKNPLLYPMFFTEEKVISKNNKIIADYTDKWFSDRISMLKSDNPAKLLFSTDHPSYVIKKPNHQNYQFFALLQLTFSVLLLLLIIFSNGKKYYRISFNVRKKLLRRNEQVA